IAASDKQQGGHSGPAHKNPSKLKTGLEGFGKRDNTPRQNLVFFIGGVTLCLICSVLTYYCNQAFIISIIFAIKSLVDFDISGILYKSACFCTENFTSCVSKINPI